MNKEKVVLFTANIQGGIVQFTVQLFRVLNSQGYKVFVFMPDNVKNTDLSELKDSLCYYKKEKKVLNSSSYKDIARRISDFNPLFVWYMDDSAVSQKVGLYIDGSIKQILTMHDAGNFHPSHKHSMRTWAVQKYGQLLARKFYKKVFRFVLLSKGSLITFNDNFPVYKDKTCIMNLGAHLPKDEEIRPTEVNDNYNNNYYLFFGRIDKYKGIETLLRTYGEANKCSFPLVIAGSGTLTQRERELVEKENRVLLINRYISDGEMKWLLSHSMAVVLPYIEATQSGVIPLSYYYTKPVLVSNVYGLTQFVDHGTTGYIVETDEQWIELFNNMNQGNFRDLQDDIHRYYEMYLDWNINIHSVLNEVNN